MNSAARDGHNVALLMEPDVCSFTDTPSTLHKLRTNNRRTKCGLFAYHEDYLVSRMSYTNIEELSKVIDLERSGKGHTEAKKVIICKKCFGHAETEIAIHKVHG